VSGFKLEDFGAGADGEEGGQFEFGKEPGLTQGAEDVGFAAGVVCRLLEVDFHGGGGEPLA
jgi:hypothetical protein